MRICTARWEKGGTFSEIAWTFHDAIGDRLWRGNPGDGMRAMARHLSPTDDPQSVPPAYQGCGRAVYQRRAPSRRSTAASLGSRILRSCKRFPATKSSRSVQSKPQCADHHIALDSPADVRRLAQILGVDAVVIGVVTDYCAYYPPRCGLQVEWYAANPCFHPIPPGYGLPWGTPAEEDIPEPLVLETEMSLAREQLKTQTPGYQAPVEGPPGAPVEVPALRTKRIKGSGDVLLSGPQIRDGSDRAVAQTANGISGEEKPEGKSGSTATGRAAAMADSPARIAGGGPEISAGRLAAGLAGSARPCPASAVVPSPTMYSVERAGASATRESIVAPIPSLPPRCQSIPPSATMPDLAAGRAICSAAKTSSASAVTSTSPRCSLPGAARAQRECCGAGPNEPIYLLRSRAVAGASCSRRLRLEAAATRANATLPPGRRSTGRVRRHQRVGLGQRGGAVRVSVRRFEPRGNAPRARPLRLEPRAELHLVRRGRVEPEDPPRHARPARTRAF